MNNFFATPEGAWGDGSVHLTTIGIVIVVVVIAALIVVAAILRHRNSEKKQSSPPNSLYFPLLLWHLPWSAP